jgi:three-Cys-motif partner protein
VEEDGHHLPDIKRHSLKKIRLHNFYAALFSKAMSRQWHHRVYIGLYAGAGRALVQPGGELVETSALAVLRQEYPFTKYIFVDKDVRCIEALRARIDALRSTFDVTLIPKPVNDAVADIVRALPRYDPTRGEGMIALCFVDPFRVDLDFEVIRRLGRYKIDFLVMLPLGYDVKRNLRRYLDDEGDDRLGALIDAPDWREQWRAAKRPVQDTVSVKVTGMGVYLYSLAFYTRHELGEQFWKTTIAGTESQYDIGL